MLWLIINYGAAGGEASLSTATSSVKRAGGTPLLTVPRLGCPLVELELREQGAVLPGLLNVTVHAISSVVVMG